MPFKWKPVTKIFSHATRIASILRKILCCQCRDSGKQFIDRLHSFCVDLWQLLEWEQLMLDKPGRHIVPQYAIVFGESFIGFHHGAEQVIQECIVGSIISIQRRLI